MFVVTFFIVIIIVISPTALYGPQAFHQRSSGCLRTVVVVPQRAWLQVFATLPVKKFRILSTINMFVVMFPRRGRFQVSCDASRRKGSRKEPTIYELFILTVFRSLALVLVVFPASDWPIVARRCT